MKGKYAVVMDALQGRLNFPDLRRGFTERKVDKSRAESLGVHLHA